MNVQAFSKVNFRNIASLAAVSVTGTGTTRLTFPVWPIIFGRPTPPRRVILTVPVRRFPFGKARVITEIMLVLFNLIWFSLKRFSARITINDYGLALNRWLAHLPSIQTTLGTEVVFFNCARRNPLFFTAPITYNVVWSVMTLPATIKVLGLLKAIRLNLYRIATRSTINGNRFLLAGTTTLLTTIFSPLGLVWQNVKRLFTPFTSDAYMLCDSFSFEFLRSKSVTTFLGTGQFCVAWSHIKAFTTDGALALYSSFLHRLNVITKGNGSQVIGGILLPWKKWMHNTQRTDPDEIRRLAKAAEEAVPEGQLDLFDELEEVIK